MPNRFLSPTESIECPLCGGSGELTRAEILDRLGVKDFARVAQLSAEEAFRLFTQKQRSEEQSAWSRFESELTKRTAEIRERHKDELRLAMSERENLSRRVEDCLRELAQLRERNQELEGEMSKAARIGKREEMTFEQQVRTWAGIWISDKLPRNGDFILAYRAPNGDPVEPRILIDNKDKSTIAESDIDKLVRDARERSIGVAALVARDETQLRQVDRDSRWSRTGGVWVLRSTRLWLPRDLDVLKPIFERMQVQGFDLLEKNAVLAEEAYIATCGGRKAVRTWLHLESSLLAVFRERYWGLPKYNRKKGSVRYAEDVSLFRRRALEKILLRFGD